ncbi:MAG: hypothetical protein EKK53_07535 [Burkholderiales bacterium]|nr:MAG: hypothetical protein EKK53_07535 [Burkholderiales bacterium]
MRDDRTLLRWLDLSWFAPMPLSMGLATWAVMTRPDPAVLAVMLVVQMTLMASACSVPAGIAARRSQVWWRRLAPSAFTQAVHRTWREQMLTLLVLGLVGPAAAAVRALDMGALALAGWALALPLLGAVLGTLAAWAWSGSLRPVGVFLWPALIAVALLMAQAPATWLGATGPAVGALAAGALLLAGAWLQSHRLRPRWTGMRPWFARWQRSPSAMRRWRWDTLAFDDQTLTAAGRPAAWATQHLPFILLGLSGAAPLKALMAHEISGGSAVDFMFHLSLLITYAMTGMLVRVGHWRLRLAPGGPSQRRQVAWMLAASMLGLMAILASIVGFHAWRQDLSAAALALPLMRAACDAALVVAFVAWLRGLSNRGVVVLMAWLGIVGAAGMALWALHAQGLVVSRGVGTLAGEAVAAAVLGLLAARAWRHRMMRGTHHGDGPKPD